MVYRCCYSTGKQWIFTEASSSPIREAVAVVVLLGLIVGTIVGILISVVDIFVLALALVCLTVLTLIYGYVFWFTGYSGSKDRVAFVVLLVIVVTVLVVSYVAVYFVVSRLEFPSRLALLCVGTTCLSTALYVFVGEACVEDQRKHAISVCTSSGKAVPMSAPSPEKCEDKLLDLYEFASHFCSKESVSDLFITKEPHLPSIDEGHSEESILVFNRTLKLVKVVLYARHDCICWIPVGGVAGPCVGFVAANSSRSFLPPRCGANDFYRMKVFQPGLLDKELAVFPKVHTGQSLGFFDIEGMVRRDKKLPRILQNKLSVIHHMTSESEMSDFSASDVDSGREQEQAFEIPKLGRFASPLLKSSRSTTCLSSSSQGQVRRSSISPARPASPFEIVLRNRSRREIRVMLFVATDLVQLVPLNGPLRGGDIVPKAGEVRLRPPSNSGNEFNLQLFSVGPASKQLTYLTVVRGQVYVCGDSLVF